MTQASRSSQPVPKDGWVKAGRSSSTKGARESIMVHMGGPPFLKACHTFQDTRNPPPLQPPRACRNMFACSEILATVKLPVLPADEPLALVDEGLRAGRHRLRRGVLEHSPHGSPTLSFSVAVHIVGDRGCR